MTRPALTHEGFLIPNAGDVSNPRMAEPDRIDFNTIAGARWGVVDGCLVTVSGLTALISPGLAIVNSTLVTVLSQSLSIPSGGAQDRFDLVVVNEAGIASSITGTYAVDPVFPDPPVGVTVLAAIFAQSATSNLSDNVIDKRKFLSKALLTKIDPGAMLVQNKNDVGNHFTLTGGGTLTWEGDTGLWRSAPYTLRVNRRLMVDETVQAGGDITTDGNVTATGAVKGRNLLTGSSGARPITGTTGQLYQDETSGKLYVWRGGAWKELATLDSAQPTGCIMTSVEPPSVMIALGWLPLDGRTITEAEYPAMFNLTALTGYISGTSPNRVMTLPNAEGRVPLTRWALGAGGTGGPASNRITLSLANMPRHRHNIQSNASGSGAVQGTVGRAGTHGHGISGGEHSHTVNDPGHRHNALEGPGWMAQAVGLFWGGRNKTDAYFNDRNHTFSVEAYDWTGLAPTGITINSGGSTHGHIIDQGGDHEHPLYLNSIPSHSHNIVESDAGDGTSFDITPAHLTVFTYIRS